MQDRSAPNPLDRLVHAQLGAGTGTLGGGGINNINSLNGSFYSTSSAIRGSGGDNNNNTSSGWSGLEDYRSENDHQSRTFAARSVLWHKLRKRYETDASGQIEMQKAVKKRVERGMKEEAEIINEYQKEIAEW